ncbi:MAG: hypothetical protein ACFFFH_00495 [Candidatus Thorarchaeota archaeon]
MDNIFLLYFLQLFGSLFGGYSLFNTSLLYLSMDEDEVNNDLQREGRFLGMNALFTKPTSMLNSIVATITLTVFNYLLIAVVQPESALIGIK